MCSVLSLKLVMCARGTISLNEQEYDAFSCVYFYDNPADQMTRFSAFTTLQVLISYRFWQFLVTIPIPIFSSGTLHRPEYNSIRLSTQSKLAHEQTIK
jgi:hypothetical protein